MGRPESPSDSPWAVFARNHDELTLDKLSGAERQDVFDAFGPDEGMQVYGRGLRRRLPPMLDNDGRRIRLVYSLMVFLPGTPTLFYGEEIGMAENLVDRLKDASRSIRRRPRQVPSTATWSVSRSGSAAAGSNDNSTKSASCRRRSSRSRGPDAESLRRQRCGPAVLRPD